MDKNRAAGLLCALLIPAMLLAGCGQTPSGAAGETAAAETAAPAFDAASLAGDWYMTIEAPDDMALAAAARRPVTLNRNGLLSYYGQDGGEYFLRYTADETTMSLYGSGGYYRTASYTASDGELTLSVTAFSDEGGAPYSSAASAMLDAALGADNSTLQVEDRWVVVRQEGLDDAGNSLGWNEYELDGHGFRSKTTDYSSDGSVLATHVKTRVYDSGGHLIWSAGKDGGAGGTYTEYEREFSVLGQVTKVTETEYEEFRVRQVTVSEYDGGLVTRKVMTSYTGTGSEDGSLECDYTYDAAGNQIRETVTDNEGKAREYDMTYDEHGNVLTKPYFGLAMPYFAMEDNGEDIFSYYSYDYGADGRIRSKVEKETTQDGEYVTTWTYTRDGNGNAVRVDIVSESPAGTTAEHTLYTYMMLSEYLAQKGS